MGYGDIGVIVGLALSLALIIDTLRLITICIIQWTEDQKIQVWSPYDPILRVATRWGDGLDSIDVGFSLLLRAFMCIALPVVMVPLWLPTIIIGIVCGAAYHKRHMNRLRKKAGL